MSAALASAVPMPAPVIGYAEFNGIPAEGALVTVTNKATGEVLSYLELSSLKTEKGKFAFDLGNFKQGYTVKDRRGSGDTVEIKVCAVIPECVYSYEIIDTSVKTVRLDLM